MKKLIAAIIIVTLLTFSNSYACEPLQKKPNIRDSVKRSGFIIVGKRAHAQDYLKNYGFNTYQEKPRRIEIIQVLKGIIKAKEIIVRGSWGMCGIAFNFPDTEDYLMFIRKIDDDVYEADFGPAGDYNDINSLKLDKNEIKHLADDGFFDLHAEPTSIEEFVERFIKPRK